MMEVYRKKARSKLKFYIVLMVISLLLLILGMNIPTPGVSISFKDFTDVSASSCWWPLHSILEYGSLHGPTWYALTGFCTLLLVALFVHMIVKSIRYGRALRNEARLRELIIYENDERNQDIAYRSGNTSYTLVLTLLAIAAFVMSLSDLTTTIALTLIAVFLSMVLVNGLLRIYYHKKL